ncbi:uncharacterized protein LACBIDRAFT_329281 [Laccaria bicolor S238N-H82]|uniref:Predicted protein n=1 Tax=Laccaria bicolor (strain S238N-H82 / ATCC MYA-4686) TaxID=486041 RepID=B0DH27_LACBS|nr:uncharacterized protein LACBIDRAFT_329281 [Laccaria bicolor S238N-H82]EDR06121.1 predicted protein [Laccaria bicolor S238N-H82]|eukprot:XP_001883409.1 predicted protein [Laccaria bicolor S238N-H82]
MPHGMKQRGEKDLAHPAQMITAKACRKHLTKPRKRLQKGRCEEGESKHGAVGSEETRAKSQKGRSSEFLGHLLIVFVVITAATSNSDIHNNVHNSTKLPTKGKPTPKIKKTNLIEADDSDNSSISSLSDGSQGRLGKSDSDDEDDNDFDVARMTDREFRQMFNKEKSPLAGKGPALKLRAPPHLIPKGCLMIQTIQAKRRLMKTTPEVLSNQSLACVPASRPTTQAIRSMVQKSKSKVGAATIASDDDDKAIPEDNWPKALQLRTGTLTQQTDLIRVVCREAIQIIEKTLVTENAWPELPKGTLYKRQVLLEAVKLLHAKNTEDDKGKQDAQYKALTNHLSIDEKFARHIGKWHVHALIENDVYVYPGHWAADKDGKPIWMVKNSVTDIQIYLNPGLINLIKTAFFNSPTGFGYKFKKYYVSSHPTLKDPELMIPIVALGATAFFAALYEWREGKKGKMSADSQKAKAKKFEGDNFKKVFNRHIDNLTKLKKKVNTYHKIMSELYAKVTDGDNTMDTGALTKGSALAVLDLDGLD